MNFRSNKEIIENGIDTESSRAESSWVEEFLSITRLFHPPDSAGNDTFPVSSDGALYTAGPYPIKKYSSVIIQVFFKVKFVS